MPVQFMLLMAGLVFLPAILLTMTSFTRIIIVLSLLCARRWASPRPRRTRS